MNVVVVADLLSIKDLGAVLEILDGSLNPFLSRFPQAERHRHRLPYMLYAPYPDSQNHLFSHPILDRADNQPTINGLVGTRISA